MVVLQYNVDSFKHGLGCLASNLEGVVFMSLLLARFALDLAPFIVMVSEKSIAEILILPLIEVEIV